MRKAQPGAHEGASRIAATFVDAEIRSVRLFQRLTHRRRQGLGVNGLIVVEAAAEAKRHTDQQRACDELTCVIHDVKSPVFELGD